jgi:hypothetical protein
MKYLIAAVVLLASIGLAVAASNVHESVVGEWCQQDALVFADIWYRREPGEDCTKGFYLLVEPTRYEFRNKGQTMFTCRNTDVKITFDPKIPVATKTPPGVFVSKAAVTCKYSGNPDCPRREVTTFYFSKGMLYMRNKMLPRTKAEEKACPAG